MDPVLPDTALAPTASGSAAPVSLDDLRADARRRADLAHAVGLELAGGALTAPTGWGRLMAAMRPYAGCGPEVLCKAVEQDVVEHVAGHAHDDMTMLAASVRD